MQERHPMMNAVPLWRLIGNKAYNVFGCSRFNVMIRRKVSRMGIHSPPNWLRKRKIVYQNFYYKEDDRFECTIYHYLSSKPLRLSTPSYSNVLNT